MSDDTSHVSTLKLGKLPPRHDARTLRLETYLDPKALPPIPSAFDFADGVNLPMWLNDRIGDCGIAAPAGLATIWNARAGKPVTITDKDVLKSYSDVSGFDQQTGQNDNGCVLLDVLKYLMTTGIAGHTIGAYGDVGNSNTSLMFAAIWLCEGLNIGVQLPFYCEQTNNWLQPSNQIAGGHDVILTGADGTGNFIGRTWGGRKLIISPRFMGAQCDELHFELSKDQLDGKGLAANHLSMADIQTDVLAVGKLDTPPMPVIPVPGPPTPPPSPTPTPTPVPVTPPPSAPWYSYLHIPARPGDWVSIGKSGVQVPKPYWIKKP